jgi:hypothetical protein
MTARDDLDRQLNDFLRDGPTELPYQSFDAVRDLTEQTGQRVVIGPWRLPETNKIVTIGVGAAAVVVALIVGAQLFGSPSGGLGDAPSQTSGPSVVEPTATPEPSPSPTSAPPLTQSFISTLHGISLSYPEGWTAQAATEPWTDSTFALNFLLTHSDFLYDPTLTDNLFLTIASQPIGDSTPEEWAAAQMASDEGCPAPEPIAVDGATGLIGAGDCHVAVVTTAGRGYWIQLYASGDELSAYDLAWFEGVLATVQLHPENAVDSRPSPSP